MNIPPAAAASTRAHASQTSAAPAASAANPRKPVQPDARVQVRKLSQQLEAVFINQLFQAMRASVPKDEVLGNAPGQEMFTAMMDERLANESAQRLERGLGENLYRQLARRLPQAAEGNAP